MPELSRFHGITISMYWREDHHHTPHFHARHGEHKASFNLAGEIVAGQLPRRQLHLVQAWTALHADELAANWNLVAGKKPPAPLAPLR